MRFNVVQAVLWLFLPGSLLSQKLNTPTDFKSLAKTSLINYEYNTSKWAMPVSETVSVNPDISINKFSETFFVKKRKAKAVRLMAEKQYDSARQQLGKALKAMPQHSELMSMIAKIFEEEGNTEAALTWYKKATEANYIDYEAYLKTAQILAETGEYELAFKAVLYAKVLNRNAPDVQESVKTIAHLNGFVYKDWAFVPKFKLSGETDNIKICHGGGPWEAYALSEAFWEYEPEYAATKTVNSEYELEMIRYKENLLNGIIAYELMRLADKQVQYPEIEAFGIAVDEELIDQYIQYEIFGVKDPNFIHSLQSVDIQQIVQYLLLTHFEKLPEKYALK